MAVAWKSGEIPFWPTTVFSFSECRRRIMAYGRQSNKSASEMVDAREPRGEVWLADAALSLSCGLLLRVYSRGSVM